MPSLLNQVLRNLPETVRPLVQKALASAPPDVQREFVSQLEAIQKLTSNNPAVYSDLMAMVKRLASPALQPLSNIAIVGSINVGKSTLFNAMLPHHDEKAAVSPIPGTTKENQLASMGLFTLLDTPGVDHGAQAGQKERLNALTACEDSDFIILLFDASRGITTGDKQFYNYVKGLGKPFIIALNKIDLISKKNLPDLIESCAATLGVPVEEVNTISAEKHKGVEQLLLAASACEPRLLGELGKNLPSLRQKLAWQAIRRSSIASAAIALSPLPVVDFIPLTAVQIALVLTISRIYDKPMSKARALEMVGSLGMGLLGRTLFQELAKLGGPPGWALSAAIAVATTISIGYCVCHWFATGIEPSRETVKQISKTVYDKLLKMGPFRKGKRTSSKKIEQEIAEPLRHITEELSQDLLLQTGPAQGTDEPKSEKG